MHIDDILNEVGVFGAYQKRIFAWLAFPCMSAGAFVLVVYNVLATPTHRCKIPFYENDTYEIQSVEHERLINLTIPSSKDPTLLYDKCNAYITDMVSLENVSDVYHTENATTFRCSEWVYDKTVFKDTFVSMNNLVCHDSMKTSHIQMLLFVGLFIGAFGIGSFSDRFGRKMGMCISLTVLMILSIGVAFSPGVYVYAILQLGIGATSHGAFLCIAVLVMEIVGPSKRLWTGMLVQVYFSIGICYVALVGFLLRSWRWTTLAVALPTVSYLSYWCLAPESPRWLISKNRKDEAVKVIEQMAKTNKKGISYSPAQLTDVPTEHAQQRIWHIIKSPVLLTRLLILALNWMVVSMTYYGVTLNAGNLGGNYYVNFFLMGFVEIPGVFYGMVVMYKFGRRPSMSASMILGGLACIATIPAAVIGSDHLQPLVITLALVGKCLASAAFAIVYMYTAEILPTVIRNAGMGTCSCGARIGGMLAPYIAKTGELIGGKFGKVEPLLVFGALSVIAGLLILPLPETQNRKLPDTIQEGEQFGRTRNEDAGEVVDIPMLAAS